MEAGNRGFVELQTPMGVALIFVGLFLTIGFIVAGAAFARAVERENRARREAMRSTKSPPPEA
jgi:hypothetical protein